MKYKIGQIVEDLEIINILKEDRVIYVCRCLKCGTQRNKRSYELTNLNGTKHKGCGKKDRIFDKRFSDIYNDAKRRCEDTKRNCYKYYGGRGIKFKFECYSDFYILYYNSYISYCAIHGVKNTTLDRIDTDGNYEVGNIRWATMHQQNKNKNLKEIGKRISASKTKYNLKEIKPYYEKYINKKITIKEIMQETGISSPTLWRKFKKIKEEV